MNKSFHLAQINTAQAQDSMDSLHMQGFVERLDEINALADNALGFIWRLQSDQGDATAIRIFDDPLLLVNMSVWKDVQSLKNYVYRSAHIELIQNKKSWFNKSIINHQALWWIKAGLIPTEQQGKDKLSQLKKEGPSSSVFTFAQPYDCQKLT